MNQNINLVDYDFIFNVNKKFELTDSEIEEINNIILIQQPHKRWVVAKQPTIR